LRQVGGFYRFLHQQNWPPRYTWNIVDNIVKQHNTLQYNSFFSVVKVLDSSLNRGQLMGRWLYFYQYFEHIDVDFTERYCKYQWTVTGTGNYVSVTSNTLWRYRKKTNYVSFKDLGHAVTLVIMSVSTFKTVVILYFLNLLQINKCFNSFSIIPYMCYSRKKYQCSLL